ncbi:hypothetical protein VNI00_006610 [Paramarasmius palmivorus]|uniref:Uncharacterized protein n=1 Tax=Paramarasmius palmivorus TaxID=297713 RepID=A0AAW0D7G9_9AGAR
MQLTSIFVSLLPLLSFSSASALPNVLIARQSSSSRSNTTSAPISLSSFFDAQLVLGAPGLNLDDIDSWNTSWSWSESRLKARSDDNTILAAPIISGTVTGQALNGTIRGGIAFPQVYDDDDTSNTTTWSYATVWGTASDGTSFVVEESGVGTTSRHIARLIVNTGGNYTELENSFILAEIVFGGVNASASANTTMVSVSAYKAW